MDDDIYAYEHEMDEMDEWEAMHAHEMEAAEEAMREMDAVEAARAPDAAPNKAVASSTAPAARASAAATREQDSSSSSSHHDAMDAASAIDAKIARAQERLNQVLNRCATLMGEDDENVASPSHDSAAPVGVDDPAARPGAPLQPLQQTHQQKKTKPSADAATASYLHSRPPMDVDSLSVVLGADGRRMFLRKKAPSSTSASAATAASTASALSLVPIQAMLASIERRQIEAAVAKDSDASLGDLAPLAPSTPPPSTPVRANVLWLDKYKPKRFIDLLSDERTNREVLKWIKTWDRYVFPHKKRPDGSAASRSAQSDSHAQGFGAKSARFSGNDHSSSSANGAPDADDDDPRPFQKLILICGPPGAGKTTLANIVARHAGYNPIEVNASDDRTAGVLKNKIISAMEMQSIFGERKPNCIILDEIDGAMNGGDGKTAIAAIHDIVAAALPSKKHAKGAKRTGGASSSHHPLTRPLICICNDQYASVLRPLRKLAKIFVLEAPHAQRLVTRLKFICKSEQLKTTTGALSSLAATGGNDIRYCVNALQFHSTQPTRSIATIASGLVGQKDQASGVYDALSMVFYKPKTKARAPGSAAPSAATDPSASPASPPSAFSEIEEVAHSMGNFPLLLHGLDENLPKMIFNDATMSKLCDAFEWLGLADAWDTRARSEQQFAFQAYVPFAAMAVHTACCTSSRRRIEYPRAHFAAQQHHERASNILEALVENSQLHQSLRVSAGILAVDVVPWLVAVLSPTIRRVNPTLQTADEKAMLARLIELMASLGLSFRPKFLPDGSEDYALEPALHELLVFRGSESAIATLPVVVKKMVTREVELQQMRRTESSSSASRRDAATARGAGAATESTAAAPAFVLPELSSEKMAEKLEAMRKRNPFAFAHREAKRKRDESEKLERAESAQRQRDDSGDTRPVVRYKFNEGYTCGIITTVYMRDLL